MIPIVILAGGLATRLYPETKDIPKSMIKIANKPFIYWQLKLLKEKGFEKVILCVNHLAEQIVDYVKDGKDFGLIVQYSYDGDVQLGTGGAIKKAIDLLDDTFFIMYGDSYLDIDYSNVLNKFPPKKLGLMTIYKNDNELEPSNVLLRHGEIVKYDKKINSLEMTYIDYGLGVFKKNAFAMDCFDLSDVYTYLIDEDRLANYIVEERFYEIGSKKGIEETEKYILEKYKEKTCSI